jgi:hypothetical protein
MNGAQTAFSAQLAKERLKETIRLGRLSVFRTDGKI